MRWGLPAPASTRGAPITNIRNVSSPDWRQLLGVEHRCLVPFTAFSEYEDSSLKGAKVIRWFAPTDGSMRFFAGVGRVWSGDYGSKKELTTEANDLVRSVHAKAMPVVLVDEHQAQEWLSAPANNIADIQSWPLPPNALRVLDDQEAAAFTGAYLR